MLVAKPKNAPTKYDFTMLQKTLIAYSFTRTGETADLSWAGVSWKVGCSGRMNYYLANQSSNFSKERGEEDAGAEIEKDSELPSYAPYGEPGALADGIVLGEDTRQKTRRTEV